MIQSPMWLWSTPKPNGLRLNDTPDTFYLAAEIVSKSDRSYVESKREIYKLHAHCECILTVQQDRCEVRVDRRTQGGWEDQVLNKLDDELVLADFGLRCKLSDPYRGTTIRPR